MQDPEKVHVGCRAATAEVSSAKDAVDTGEKVHVSCLVAAENIRVRCLFFSDKRRGRRARSSSARQLLASWPTAPARSSRGRGGRVRGSQLEFRWLARIRVHGRRWDTPGKRPTSCRIPGCLAYHLEDSYVSPPPFGTGAGESACWALVGDASLVAPVTPHPAPACAGVNGGAGIDGATGGEILAPPPTGLRTLTANRCPLVARCRHAPARHAGPLREAPSQPQPRWSRPQR